MSASVLRLPVKNGNGNATKDLRDRLAGQLSVLNIKLCDARLGLFQTYDISGRRVLFLGGNTDSPYCIVKNDLEGRLLGNFRMRELPMTITCLRSASRSIIPILHCGAFDGIRIRYFMDEIAIVVDAAFLSERLSSFR